MTSTTNTIRAQAASPIRSQSAPGRTGGAPVASLTGADAAQLLHLAADAQVQAQVDAHGPDVGARLARHPENTCRGMKRSTRQRCSSCVR